MYMDQVDTLHVDRYWSQVLLGTIMTNLYDLEVKVTDLENFVFKFWLNFFYKSTCLEHIDVSKLILCMFADIGLTIMSHLSDLEVKVMCHRF